MFLCMHIPHNHFPVLPVFDIDFHRLQILHFSSREYSRVDWNLFHMKVLMNLLNERVYTEQEKIWIPVNLFKNKQKIFLSKNIYRIQLIESTTISSDIPALFNAEHERYWLCIWRVTVKCNGYRPSIVGDIRWRMVLLIFQLIQNQWKFSYSIEFKIIHTQVQ
jgi:hypothetical protein